MHKRRRKDAEGKNYEKENVKRHLLKLIMGCRTLDRFTPQHKALAKYKMQQTVLLEIDFSSQTKNISLLFRV